MWNMPTNPDGMTLCQCIYCGKSKHMVQNAPKRNLPVQRASSPIGRAREIRAQVRHLHFTRERHAKKKRDEQPLLNMDLVKDYRSKSMDAPSR
jgi:hypothetical protein